jgi:hypothetical protein
MGDEVAGGASSTAEGSWAVSGVGGAETESHKEVGAVRKKTTAVGVMR